MLNGEYVAIRDYNAKSGKFLVLVNDQNGYHLECRKNRLAKLPFFGKLVRWYYARKLPSVIQYLLSEGSGFKELKIDAHREKVKNTLDRFFMKPLQCRLDLQKKVKEAYDRAFIQLALTDEQKHDLWVKNFVEKFCYFEQGIRQQYVDGLKIESEMVQKLQFLLERLPNLRFYFTCPIGARPNPSPGVFKNVVKDGPEDALWVLVAAFLGKCSVYGPASFEVLNGKHVFSLYQGECKKGLGLSHDHINRGAFNHFFEQTTLANMVDLVAASTKAIREME